MLHEHAANAEVMQYACWALNNIGASDRALQKRIREAGAEPVVRAAVNAPDATADTRKWGQRLLDKLAEVSVCVECAGVYMLARSCLPFHKRECLYMQYIYRYRYLHIYA